MAEEGPQELLSALESIKGLLEKSEVKLNAARESIELASSGSHAVNQEPEESFEVPELDDIVVPAHADSAQPTVDMEVLKVFLDEMQKQIEKSMRDKLMKSVVAAENDIKKQLRAYLDQLRKMLDQGQN